MPKSSDCTLLVTSCDAYRDVDAPHAALLRKFWPDCPFEAVLLTETGAEAGFDRVIRTGRGKTWSEMLVEALDEIDTPYVMLAMNDNMPAAPIDTQTILRRLDEARRLNAANVRLVPLPPGTRPWPGTDLLERAKDTGYCVSCQTGLWNRAFLRDLAKSTRSAWEFERRGSFMLRGEKRPMLVAPTREYFDVDTLHKGYWTDAGMKLLTANGVACDFSVRGKAPFGTRLKEAVKGFIFKIVPWTLLVRIQNALIKP